jgi:FkbM family methyltransferase
VGTNVGNHAVFYASCTYAAAIYLFEPNVRARKILDKSLGLNDFSGRVCLDYYTLAVGAENGHLFIAQEYENNLGATHFSKSLSGDGDQIKCVTLDSLTFKGDISLIKIDVEGMELNVLAGAEATIQKHRPALAIEVNSVNHAEFWQWLKAYDYHVINMYHESKGVRNYIAVPGG